VPPVFREKTRREKRRKLHESLRSWAGRGRWGPEGDPQCNWEVGGMFRKPHTAARWASVSGCLLSPR